MKTLVAALALLFCGPALCEPTCFKTGEVCAEPHQTRSIDGVPITRACWRWQDSYQCRSADTTSTCQPLRDQGCTQIGSVCVDKSADGSCSMYEQHYQCPLAPAKTEEKIVCNTGFCQDGSAACFDTTRPADKDFGIAAASMEAAREAGVYGIDPNGVEIFKGYMEECSIKVLGGSSIKSCCGATGGGGSFTNYTVVGLSAKAAYAVGKEEIKAGSKYMYDALFQVQDATIAAEGASAAAGGLTPGATEGVAASAGTNFGAYGFTFSYSSSGGFAFVGFDPYSFAFAIAVYAVTEWLSCEQEEQVMAMKQGQNLCVHIDTYCSTNAFGVCTVSKQRHCCFNSVLAKIINRQGRAQLGMPMDQCGGFTPTELQALDFSTIDMAEFIATISPTAINTGQVTTDVSATVNNKVSNYYGDNP